MTSIVIKGNKIVEFSDLDIGEFFKYGDLICLKIANSGVNTYVFKDKEMIVLDDRASIVAYNAEILIETI